MRAEYWETMLPVLRLKLMLLAYLIARFHASVMKPLLPFVSIAAVVVLEHFGHLQMAPDGNGSSGQHLLESRTRILYFRWREHSSSPSSGARNHDRRSHGLPRISEAATPSPAEYQTLFRKALQEPNSLTPDDIEVLAASTCQSAIRKVNYAMPAAEFCVAVMEPTNGARHWGSYVIFLAELLDGLNEAENTAGPSRSGGAHAAKARCMTVLATLICASCRAMLQPPSSYIPSE
ncbi:hypothetical protein MRX96_052209, partial [Rhipicephalus microplus]